MSDPNPQTPRAGNPSPASVSVSSGVPNETGEWRRVVGRILGILVVLGAAVLVLWVWKINERHPRTDDATVRANVVEIAPRVRGQIIKINVEDNQEVKTGDVLFEIDPDDYRLTLEKAKAALATLDQQIEVARAQDEQLRFQVKAAEAGVEAAKAQLKQAGDTLHRLEPLLPKGFAKADDVDKARTSEQVAAASLAAEEQRLNQAKTALSGLAALLAQRPGAVAAVEMAALDLAHCKVVAPFPGRVVSLNLSPGAYVSVGVPVFSLLDTRRWYVMANFREGEIRHISPDAAVDIYLLADPKRRFAGKVQGIGWAVHPEGEIDLQGRVPMIRRELNWVHIAQRFPVRIEIENPDPALLRMGASAVAIVQSKPSDSR